MVMALHGMGGSATTLTGLAGLGDLTLSCTSTQSRNYRYGVSLGRGEPAGTDLAEGVLTAPVAKALADQLRIDAPLIDAVNLLIEGNTSITAIVAGLMLVPGDKGGTLDGFFVARVRRR